MIDAGSWLWFVVAVIALLDRHDVAIVVEIGDLLLHLLRKLLDELLGHGRLSAQDAECLLRVCPAPPCCALLAAVEKRICLIIGLDDVVGADLFGIRLLPEVDN